jgi:hypothetical protein
MDPQSLVIVFRMLERILGVGLGGLLIYFGYRLFLDVRGKREGSGDFSIAGGNKIKISKVGPGVFFAIFGAGLVAFSLVRPVSFTSSQSSLPEKGAAPAVATMQFMGATAVPEPDEERTRRREEMKPHISALNRAVTSLAPASSAKDRADFERAVARAKLAFMEPLWAEDWGDLADFREWIEKRGPVPPGVTTAVEFYQQR